MIVRMVELGVPEAALPRTGPATPAQDPWYARPWGWGAIGAAGVVAGILVGRALAGTRDVIDCDEDPASCMP